MDFSPPRRKAPLLLDLTPLIDVVFLLLIFFMVSTTFEQDPAGLKVDLPRSDNREVIREDGDLRLRLVADGQILLGDQNVDLEGLRKRLLSAAKEDPNTLVVVEADHDLDHGRVVSVMDLARGVGLTRFAIATAGAE